MGDHPSAQVSKLEPWVDVPLERTEDSSSTSSQESAATQFLSASQVSSSSEVAVLALLRTLRPHGLARTRRIHRDIASLAGIALDDVDTYLLEHTSDASAHFTQHIEAIVANKPHVLLAYAFVMYMAIFSGGRWIRSMLAAPGAGFWSAFELPQSPPGSPPIGLAYAASSVHEKLRTFNQTQQETFEKTGLSLWFWSGLNDGLDIKAEFKHQLDLANELLTEEMRSDILAESRDIFIRCESLVGELDERVGRMGIVVKGVKSREEEALEAGEAESEGALKFAPELGQDRSQNPGWLISWTEAPPSRFAGLAIAIGCLGWYVLHYSGVFDLANYDVELSSFRCVAWWTVFCL